jgi:hypothetical protein
MLKKILIPTLLLIIHFNVGMAQSAKYSIVLSKGLTYTSLRNSLNFKRPGSHLGLRFQYPAKGFLTYQLGFSYNIKTYIEPQGYSTNSANIGIGIIEPMFAPYLKENGHPDGVWFPSYKNTMIIGDAGLRLSFLQLLTGYEATTWDIGLNLGIGVMRKSIHLDMLYGDNQAYSDISSKVGGYSFNTSDGRDEIRRRIDKLYDGKYETADNLNNLYQIVISNGIDVRYSFDFGLQAGFGFEGAAFLDNKTIKSLPRRTFNSLANGNTMLRTINLFVGYRW